MVLYFTDITCTWVTLNIVNHNGYTIKNGVHFQLSIHCNAVYRYTKKAFNSKVVTSHKYTCKLKVNRIKAFLIKSSISNRSFFKIVIHVIIDRRYITVLSSFG